MGWGRANTHKKIEVLTTSSDPGTTDASTLQALGPGSNPSPQSVCWPMYFILFY